MSATVKLSDKKCFLCGKNGSTVHAKLKDGSFAGVVCLDDLYKILKRTEASEQKEPTDGKAVSDS